MWPASSRLGYGEMGMFVVAPATSFHHSTESLMPDSAAGSAPIGGGPTALGVGVGVIPLLTATPCLNVGGGGGGGGGGMDGDDLMINRNRAAAAGALHLWQQQQLGSSSYGNKSGGGGGSKSINFETAVGSGGVLFGGGGGGGGGTTTCQDCGNQAKKDCSHRRCRTCCRSRGFECSTHVKSTWVPAARRRERQMMAVAGTSGGGGGGGASSGSTSGAKKPRLISSQNTTTTSHTSASNTPPRSFDTSSSHQDASFKESLPGQVRAPAVFKCVRVTAVEEGEDEYAYQAVVKIGGHVFKGLLYDQGAEPREGLPNLSELHLGGSSGGAGGSGGGRNGGASSSSPLLDPPNVYGTAGAALELCLEDLAMVTP